MGRHEIVSPDSLRVLSGHVARMQQEIGNLRRRLGAYVCELDDGDGGGNRVAISTVVIPRRVGRVAGGPVEVQPVKLDSSSSPQFVNDGDPINIYSWVKTDSTDPADEEDGELYIFIEDDDHGVTWFTGQDCPPGADVET